jgi:hypothetical protein
MNKTKENLIKTGLREGTLTVYLNDERPQFDDRIWKFDMTLDIKDFNEFIKDTWYVVGEERAKDNGQYSFEQVVESCFRGLARMLDFDEIIEIKRKTTNGWNKDKKEFQDFIAKNEFEEALQRRELENERKES